MKELSIEEKAKAYDEALKRAKEAADNGYVSHNFVSDIFIELQESEDERIRKGLIKALSSIGKRNWGGIDVFESISWLEKQDEQKPADKVEPKFKVGDWVIWQNKCYKVNYNGCGYELIDQNGLSTSLEYGTVDESAHLWTIQDAKNGDVLVASDGSIFLFKGTIDWGCKHYVALTTDGAVKFNEGLKHYWETVTAVHPATKEQRDTLEKVMTDAGYTFDFVKKELKKIEQNHAWSEEDDVAVKDICDKLNRLSMTYVGNESIVCQEEIKWLKSLRPQNAWKPSEEQMDVLETAVSSLQSTALESLYNDLNKL